MNNIRFLQHPHFCIMCKSPIDMKKIERYIFNCIYYEHEPELMLPYVDNDPIVVQDHGNDLEIACSKICFFRYLIGEGQ